MVRAEKSSSSGPNETCWSTDPATGALTTATRFSPTHVYAHRWQAGDCLVWDNEVVLHSTSPTSEYAEGERREIWQIVQPCSS